MQIHSCRNKLTSFKNSARIKSASRNKFEINIPFHTHTRYCKCLRSRICVLVASVNFLILRFILFAVFLLHSKKSLLFCCRNFLLLHFFFLLLIYLYFSSSIFNSREKQKKKFSKPMMACKRQTQCIRCMNSKWRKERFIWLKFTITISFCCFLKFLDGHARGLKKKKSFHTCLPWEAPRPGPPPSQPLDGLKLFFFCGNIKWFQVCDKMKRRILIYYKIFIFLLIHEMQSRVWESMHIIFYFSNWTHLRI